MVALYPWEVGLCGTGRVTPQSSNTSVSLLSQGSISKGARFGTRKLMEISIVSRCIWVPVIHWSHRNHRHFSRATGKSSIPNIELFSTPERHVTKMSSCGQIKARWWFQICFIFIPTWEMIQFDEQKPPTRKYC